jgi:2,4-dienoyl-CoA reductase-like NADH-dependent reductase (Old Yellow Enzyme family)
MTSERFPHLFSPLTIRGVTLQNRILSTGHETALVDRGRLGDAFVAYHEARARGGAGLIISEVASVHPSGIFVRDPIPVFTDDCIPDYRRLAKVLHSHGAAFFAQLFHPGREIIETHDGSAPVSYAPSASPNERFHVMPRPMPVDLIEAVIAGYVAAAGRMEEAGADGVEIVASHGYLPAQFLNPRVNLREDAYGGSLENRLRFLNAAANGIRARVGDGFVVGLRISADESSHDGLGQDEVMAACAMLEREGSLDYYSVVAGSSASLLGSTHIVPPMTYEAGYTAPFGAAMRARVTKPIFVTGRINQPQIAERILSQGQADVCGMTRAMICDPEMANKAREGRADDIRACIGCNQACIGHFLAGYPISCIQHPETGRELEFGTRTQATRAKRVMVVGGGPAGMKAAAVAAEGGHDVTLHEAAAQLGGQVLLAQLLPTRAEFGGIVTNLAREMALAGVKVLRGSRVDRAAIERVAPDAVILATGALPRRPTFDGEDVAHVVDAWQVLQGGANVGASVVVADWRCDWVGIGIAEKLATEGCRVRLACNGTVPGQVIQQYIRDMGVGRLHKLGVDVIPYTRLYGADEDTVYLQHTTSGEAVICEEVETLVLCQGHMADATLEDDLRALGLEFHMAGDCLAPRTAEEAVLEGLKAGVAV